MAAKDDSDTQRLNPEGAASDSTSDDVAGPDTAQSRTLIHKDLKTSYVIHGADGGIDALVRAANVLQGNVAATEVGNDTLSADAVAHPIGDEESARSKDRKKRARRGQANLAFKEPAPPADGPGRANLVFSDKLDPDPDPGPAPSPDQDRQAISRAGHVLTGARASSAGNRVEAEKTEAVVEPDRGPSHRPEYEDPNAADYLYSRGIAEAEAAEFAAEEAAKATASNSSSTSSGRNDGEEPGTESDQTDDQRPGLEDEHKDGADAERADLSTLTKEWAAALAAQETASEATSEARSPSSGGMDGEAQGANFSAEARMRAGGAAGWEQLYPGFSNDAASPSAREDSLGMTEDARAFARVATSTGVSPPLAVGVFGPWGTGKSFFMNLVHGEIERISSDAKSDMDAFHRKVTQIRFNAWHYAEANLWASLVGHIFQELANATTPRERDDLLGRLSTARTLTLEAATSLVLALREHAAATDSLEEAKRNHALAQAHDDRYRDGDLFVKVLVDVFAQAKENPEIVQAATDLKAAAGSLGVDDALTATNELTNAGRVLLRDGVQGAQLLNSLARELGSWEKVLLLLATMILAPLVLVSVLEVVLDWATGLHDVARSAMVVATAVAGSLASGLKVIAGPVSDALQKLKDARSRVKKHVDANVDRYREIAKSRQADAVKALADVDAARDVLQAASRRLSEVREGLHGQSPASRLISFVRARASDGDYAKHLGIISTIRKDFEQLSRLLSTNGRSADVEDKEELKHFSNQLDALIESARYERRTAAGTGDSAAESHRNTGSGSSLKGEADADPEGGAPVREQLLKQSDIDELRKLAEPIKAPSMPFERIVLYIDDVDRCPPAKVVEVLQAVHMLLAFKLFVVFVAVDVRWVESSLQHEYQRMLGASGSEDSGLTSASDYLEKIIQIPYWIPSIAMSSAQRLLDGLLPTLDTGRDSSTIDLQEEGDLAADWSAALANEQKYVPAALEKSEVDILRHYADVIDSPRKMIRLVNVALFLKARGVLNVRPNTWEESHCLLAQVALATASTKSFLKLKSVLEADLDSHRLGQLNALRAKEGPAFNRDVALILEFMRNADIIESAIFRHRAATDWAGRLSFATA